MKFFSLFTKTPTYQRFNYIPRYYDAQKEELLQRQEQIKESLTATEISKDNRAILLPGSFSASHRRENRSNNNKNVSLVRLGIFLFLVIIFLAYLTWGKVALWTLVLFLPWYFYRKFIRH